MRLQLLLVGLFASGLLMAQDFMMQAWYWDYPSQNCNPPSNKWAARLASQASTMGNAGFTYVWLPPPTKGGSECSVGYDPKDIYDLGDFGPTRMGTRAQLDNLLSALNSNGMEAVADVVYNHRDGGDWEDNPAVEAYMFNYPNVGHACNGGITPYPINGKVRWRLPLGGTTGNTEGLYYIKFSSASAGPGFYGRGYNIYFQTSQVGWQNQADQSEVEPNGGFDCGTPNDQTQITLGINMLATVDNLNNGECGVDEFLVNLQTGDFDPSGDFLEIYVTQTGGDGTGIDIRPYDIYAAPRGANILNELALQTRTDFTNMPSGQGPMTYQNFKPNGTHPSCLAGDWDYPYFFFDVDQRESSTQDVYNEWSEWLIGDVGFGGLRMDAVKHFDPSMVTNLLNYLGSRGIEPGMIVGEIFNSDPNSLIGWVNDVNNGLTATVDVRAFDFNLRDALKDACDQHYFNFFFDVRNVFSSGMVAFGADPYNVVTFLNNHDFRGPNEPVQEHPILGYAYLLTNNKVGLPCVYYPDFFSDTPPNHPSTALQPQITELIDIHQEHIFGATSHYYLNDFGTPYASNYYSGNANQCLIYQISGGASGDDVIVAINFDDEPLQVNHQVQLGNLGFGARLDDVVGNSDFPYAVVDNSGGVPNNIYISLPARSYSVWVQRTAGVLPAELTDFTAELDKGNALLRWETSSEEQLKHYRIERSVDGRKFTTIDHVQPLGGLNVEQSYAYLDRQLPRSVDRVYYRLAIVDEDDSTDYSPIRNVTPPKSAAKMWPNPVNDQLSYTHIPAGALLEVIDVNGRIIQREVLNEESGRISTSTWRDGIYHLRISLGREILHQERIVKTE